MRWAVWFGVAGLAGIMGACGASGDAGGGSASLGEPGCSGRGDCSACSICFDKCVCENGDPNACSVACGTGQGGSANGGSGAQGGTDQGGSTSGGQGGTGATGATGGNGGTSATGDQATGIRISSISVWQSVKVPVMENGGQAPTGRASVVANRDAVFRVYVSPDADWQPRQLAAVVNVDGQEFEATATPSNESTDGEINSTFNVRVPASAITPNSAYSATLYEVGAGGPGSNAGSRYPTSGSESLRAQDTRGALDIVLVPYTINGNTPNVDSVRVAAYTKRLTALYPVSTVEISVHAAVGYSGNVSAGGGGWGPLLDDLYRLRQQEHPRGDVYYYGLLTPSSSAQAFCGGGCVAGLSNQTSANDDYGRGSIGLGVFPDGTDIGSSDTMAHELGHAHGRGHAPCGGAGGPDAAFPYSGGGIGSWGYDLTLDRLRQPTTYKDLMGYCSPNWISDYTFGAIQDRISYVNGNPAVYVPAGEGREPGEFMSFLIDGEGNITRVPDVTLNAPAVGGASSATLVDEVGNVVQEITGFYYPFAEEQFGGTLLVPKPKQLPALAYGIASRLSPAGVVAPLSVIQDNRLR